MRFCTELVVGGSLLHGLVSMYLHGDENILLYLCKKKSISTGRSLKAVPISSACTAEFTLSGSHSTGEVSEN